MSGNDETTSGSNAVSAEVLAVDQAWAELEKSIHALGQLIRNSTSPQDAQQRYEGYLAAFGLIADGHVQHLCADRKRPEYLPYIGLTYNYAGPAPDFNYFITHLEPGASYRVWGTRGDSAAIEVQQLDGWFGQNPNQRGARTLLSQSFESQGIVCDADGNFEFVLSAEKPAGAAQWWKLDPATATLLFREIFTDYAQQNEAAVLHFERLDSPQTRRQIPANWNCPESVERLRAFGRSLEQFSFCFTMGPSFAKIGNNCFRAENFGGDGGRSSQHYLQMRYEVKAGEALVCEWQVPPHFDYWSAALYNDQYSTLNFVEHQTGLNHAQAHVGADRIFRFVISDSDPGIANWLDVDGHRVGVFLLRIANCPEVSLPTVKSVPINQVRESFSGAVERLDPEGMARRIAIRREHYSRRMRR